VVVLSMEERRRVESEFFGNARANTRILPKSCALDVPAGATGSSFRAGLLQHAAAEARTLLTHSLDLFAPLLGESTTHLVLVGTL
jgi:hypothetical protein